MCLESRRIRTVYQIFGWKDGVKDTVESSQRGYIYCASCSGCESRSYKAIQFHFLDLFFPLCVYQVLVLVKLTEQCGRDMPSRLYINIRVDMLAV